MSDMRTGLSPSEQAVLDQLDDLRAHPQWGKAAPAALLTEIDLLGDTVFGKLHSLNKAIDGNAPGADVARALAAVQVLQLASAKRMAVSLLLALEQAAGVAEESCWAFTEVGPVETVPTFTEVPA